MKKQTGMLQLEFVRYKELEKLTRIKAGVSREVEKRLRHGKILEELLKQDQNAPVAMEDQVIILFALLNGFFANVEPGDVRDRLKQLVAQVRLQRPDLVEDLVRNNELTDVIKEGLHEQLARFQNTSP